MTDDDLRAFDDPRGFDGSPGPDPRVVEDEVRATFARHEWLTPDPGPLREAIGAAATSRRRRRRGAAAVGAALAIMGVLSIPLLAREPAAVAPAPDVAAPPFQTSATGPNEPLNFLFLGVDGGDGRENGSRADTVLMVHVPADRSRIYLVSIPRDLGVEVPGHGFGKLSASFYLGSDRPGARANLAAGAALTERTVSALTGVRFDATGTLTFSALRKVTDAVGGVRMCLPEAVRSQHTKRVFPAGCQRLDGAAAQDLLRQRYGLSYGAHDRDRNGQRFTEALLRQVTAPSTTLNPFRVTEIVRALGGNLVLDLDGMTPAELFSSLRTVAGADAVGIGWTYHSVPGPGGEFESLDPAESRSLFDALRRDDLAEWAAKHPHRVTR